MQTKIFTLNKVVYVTLFVLIISAVWFLYNHFIEPEPFKLQDDINIAHAQPGSFATAVKKAAPAVVNIHTTKSTPQQQGLGSGIIIDTHGHILTNYHVIESTQDITVQLPDGRTAAAKVIGTDPQTDIAVLKINLSEVPVAKLGTSATIQVGDVVLAIGNPLGLNSSVTQGIISALGAIKNLPDTTPEYSILAGNLIQTDAAINLGNSGGALIDVNGNVIGINTAIMSNPLASQGISFAIPIDTAKDVATHLINHGSVTRGWIGAQLTEISAETRQYLNYQDNQGVYVQDTLRNSPAQKAGILPGDIITKIDNVTTNDINATLRLISTLEPDRTYNLEVYRQGQSVVYPVTVAIRQ
jgi:serine protease DegQ